MRFSLLLCCWIFVSSGGVVVVDISKHLSSDVELVAVSDEERGALGLVGSHKLVAMKPLRNGTVIGVFERSSMWRVENVSSFSWIPPDCSPWEGVVASVAHAWHDWFEGDLHPLDPPIGWSDDDFTHLRGTQIWATLHDQRQAASASLLKLGLTSMFSPEQWLRSVALSRALRYRGASEEHWSLLPLTALLSFGKKTKSSVEAHMEERPDGSVDIIVHSDAKEGDCIFVRQHKNKKKSRLDNVSLMERYGIMIGKRGVSVTLTIALDRQDSMYGNKRKAFDSYFHDIASSSAQHNFRLEGNSIPKDLLFALRVYSATEVDVHDLQNAQNDKMISERNEKDAYELLGKTCLSILQKYPTHVYEDRDMLKSGNFTNSNHKHALLLRLAEKNVLMRTLALVDKEAEKLHNSFLKRQTDPLNYKGGNQFST